MDKFLNITRSDPGIEMETDDEAPSLVDLPVTGKRKKKRSLILPWKSVINACKRVLKSSSSGEEPEFEFSPSNSVSDQRSAEIFLADELFYQGRLLPLCSKSLHCHSQSSTSSMENGLSSQVMVSASPCLSRCRTTPSFSIKWRHFTRGLLNIPRSSSSPSLSIVALHQKQQSSSFPSSKSSSVSSSKSSSSSRTSPKSSPSSRSSSKSSSSSKSCVSSSKSSCSRQFAGKRAPSGQGGGSRSSCGSVRQRAGKGKCWRILLAGGNSCRDCGCIVVRATHVGKHPE